MNIKTFSSETCSLLLLLTVLFGFSSVSLAQPAEALTLKDCFQLALNRSETIAINAEFIKEAEAQMTSSLSGVLPQINYQIYSQWQDSGGSGEGSQRSRYRRFTFSQPLFSGFKEYAAIAAAKAQHKQRKSQLKRAKQLLFTDVSDAFYFLLSYQEDLQVLEDIHKVLLDTGKELKRRRGVGRSRESELAFAEASLYKTEADQESVRSQLEVGRQLLEFLIGQPFTGIKDEELPYDSVKDMNEFMAKVEQRPDIQAAQEALVFAKKSVTVARAGFWPSVILNGDAYDRRNGVSSHVAWDIGLTVNVPVFNGTQTIGQVKLAQAQQKEAELALSQTRRNAVLDIQNAYTRFTRDQARLAALKKASDAAGRNYKLQVADYKNSLANNLDVLQSLRDWQDGRRNYILVKNETKRFYWNLKVATGDIGHDAL